MFLDLCPALLPPPPPRKNIPHNITKKLEVHFPDGHHMARTHSPFPLPPRVKPIFLALGRPLLEGNQSGEFSLLRSSTDEIANRAQEALCHQFNDERVSTQTWCHASEDVVEVGAREKVSLSRAHTHTLSLSLSRRAGLAAAKRNIAVTISFPRGCAERGDAAHLAECVLKL